MAISTRIKKAATRAPKAEKVAADYGTLGAPINRSHPFYFGFIATLGALTAIVLMRALASVSQIFVLILIALFLATGLNPAVEALRKRNLSRNAAVTVIFSSVILFVIFFSLVVIPPVISQGTNLIDSAPQLLQDLMKNETINQLNTQYGLIDTLQERLKSMTSSFGSAEYFRVRLGIGRPMGSQDPGDFVLKAFSSAEKKTLPEFIDRGCDVVESLITHGLEETQSRFNS